MFYKVEYTMDLKGQYSNYNHFYVMVEALDEDDLQKMIDRDIEASNQTNSPIVDVDIILITEDDYLAEQKRQLDTIILSNYFKDKPKDNNEDIKISKAKAYHKYLNRIVAEAFIRNRVNLDDISASAYFSYLDKLTGATDTEEYEKIVSEILELNK